MTLVLGLEFDKISNENLTVKSVKHQSCLKIRLLRFALKVPCESTYQYGMAIAMFKKSNKLDACETHAIHESYGRRLKTKLKTSNKAKH